MAEAAREIAQTIVEVLAEKKGEDILLLDLLGVCSFTDYFVICTGASERTLRALANEAMQKVKAAHGTHARNKEGGAASGWVLLDYGDVIVHLFSQDMRDFYRLENLWRDGQVLVRVK